MYVFPKYCYLFNHVPILGVELFPVFFLVITKYGSLIIAVSESVMLVEVFLEDKAQEVVLASNPMYFFDALMFFLHEISNGLYA